MIVQSALSLDVESADSAPVAESPILPHGPIELAPKSGRDRLVTDLAERGMRTEAARAIGRAVVSPRTVRAQLKAPTRRRVAGGTLEVLYASVYVAAVAPSPVNPRTEANCAYPASGQLERRPPLPAPQAVTSGIAEVTLTVKDEEMLIGSLEQAEADLLREGALVDDVRADGIREPILLVAATINHDATGASMPILISSDGSTRVVSAHHIHGLKPVDVLYTMRAGDDRRLRAWIGDLRQLTETKSLSDMSDDDKAKLRTAIAPAEIVVGWIPDSPDGPIDLVGALDSRLGQIHVDPPSPWSEAAKRDLQLNSALDALEAAGDLSTSQALYLAGLLAPEEADAEGLSPELDSRAVAALHALAPRSNAVAAALRQLASRPTRIRQTARLRLAAEAAIRPLRVGMSTSLQAEARNSLESTFAVLVDNDLSTWQPHDRATPEDLRDAALREPVPGPEEEIGPATAELLARGMFWLAIKGAASLSTRGGMPDRRSPKDVLSRMARSSHAKHVLYQAIVDGRAGQSPRRVEADGSLWKGATGPDTVTETWVRQQVVPKDDGGAGDDGPAPRPEKSPEEQLTELEGVLIAEAKELADAFDALVDPKGPGGTPLVETRGVSSITANAVVDRIARVRDGIVEYRTLARIHADRTEGQVEEPVE